MRSKIEIIEARDTEQQQKMMRTKKNVHADLLLLEYNELLLLFIDIIIIL